MTRIDHSAHRKQEILAAAEKVFDTCGYAATTMEAVAAHAGISKGSIYNYFKSKQNLFTQLSTALLAGDEAETEKLVAEAIPAAEKLQKYLDHWFVRLKDYIRLGRLMLEFWATAAREERRGELSTLFRGLYSRNRHRLAAILKRGRDTGEFATNLDPFVVAAHIAAVVDGITIHAILDVGIHVDKPFLAALKQGLLASLGADKT